MNAADRRALYKAEMKQRHDESYAGKDDTGRFRDIYEPDKKSGVKFLKMKEDTHELFIVPYVTGSQHPRLKPNHSDFSLEIFVHRGVGVNQDSYVCLNRTYRKKCPICDYQEELRNGGDADDETIKALNPTKRAIYNVVCMDTIADEAKGVQIFDVSHWLFTIPLEEFAHKKREGGQVLYAHIDQGKVINFQQSGSKRTLKFTAFEFKDRPKITDEQLEQAVALDELIHVPTYDEVYEAFWAAKEEEPNRVKEVVAPSKQDVKEELVKEPAKEEKVTAKEEDVGNIVENEECPYGAAYGVDYNAYEECRTCDIRKECRDKKDELDEAAKKLVAPEKKKLTRREK